MTDRRPSTCPATAPGCGACTGTCRTLRFTDLVGRLAMREAERDPHTGLTAAEAAAEAAHRARFSHAGRRIVASAHTPAYRA